MGGGGVDRDKDCTY